MTVSYVRRLANAVSIVTIIVVINVNVIIAIKVYQRLTVFVRFLSNVVDQYFQLHIIVVRRM